MTRSTRDTDDDAPKVIIAEDGKGEFVDESELNGRKHDPSDEAYNQAKDRDFFRYLKEKPTR